MNALAVHLIRSGGENPAGRLWRVVSHALSVAMLSLFSCSLASAQTSVYHPFPDSNAVWGMGSGCIFDMTCGTGAYTRDFYNGDTLFAGQEYKVISEQHMIISGSSDCCNPDFGEGMCYLREDTIQRMVYIRPLGMDSDIVLYDFTLGVGDTLKGYFADYDFCGMENETVHSIDSILIGSTFRKRINFGSVDEYTDFSFIEGIGSTNGLKACFYGFGEMGISLYCFSVNGELLYVSPDAPDTMPCEELPVSNSDYVVFNAELTVTPNPSTGLFHLGQAAQQISVYNVQGILLFRTHGTEVDLSAYPPGVYTAVVETKKGRRVERLVVVR